MTCSKWMIISENILAIQGESVYNDLCIQRGGIIATLSLIFWLVYSNQTPDVIFS